jgi:hypothetical protein
MRPDLVDVCPDHSPLILASLPCQRASLDHNLLSDFSEGTGCRIFTRCNTAMQKENINELKANTKNDKKIRIEDEKSDSRRFLSPDQVECVVQCFSATSPMQSSSGEQHLC